MRPDINLDIFAGRRPHICRMGAPVKRKSATNGNAAFADAPLTEAARAASRYLSAFSR
jgi:hypothetical protein